MIDPQVELVRGYADEVAERIAALGKSPQGTPGAIIKDRTWDDYSVGATPCRRTWPRWTSSTPASSRTPARRIHRLEDLDLVSQDIFIGHAGELEKFQWFVRAHLENAGGQLANRGAHDRRRAAASKRQEEGAGQVVRGRPPGRRRGTGGWSASSSVADRDRYGYAMPAIAAPDQRRQPEHPSCAGAPSPLKNATPVERAGLTDVFEIGIEIRWISVSVRPIDRPAKPFALRGRRLSQG